MKKKVAIHQPNYIPWKGFFDMIRRVDEFVIYDTVQYTKNDWRNRNRIKTANGIIWLTIPVRRLSLQQKIAESKTLHTLWAKKHWRSISQAYAKAPYFHLYAERFANLYLNMNTQDLCEINYRFLKVICEILSIHTSISFSRDLELSGDRLERVIQICQQTKADAYLTGPTATCYIQEEAFAEANIELEWMDYSHYPTYEQLHGAFVHEVSILDLIFNTGPEAMAYIAVENEWLRMNV